MQLKAGLKACVGALSAALLGATLLAGCATQRTVQCTSTEVLPWYEIETPHFRIRTNADLPAALQNASGLEKYRDVLQSVWGEGLDPPGQLEVVVLRDREQLAEFADARLAAYLVRLPSGWQAVMAGKYRFESVDEVQLHELAHYLLRHLMLHQPRWVAEGLATYLQTTEVKENSFEAAVGRPHLPSLQYVRQHNFLSFADLWDEPLPRHSGQALYASSWLWVHFLLNEEGARFKDFLNRLASAEEPRAAWDAAFIGVPPQVLEQSVRRYVHDGRFPVHRLLVPAAASESTQNVLDEAEIHVTRARLYLGARKSISAAQRRELVLGEVAEALRHDPQNPSARVLLGQLVTRSNSLANGSELTPAKTWEPQAWSLPMRPLDERAPDDLKQEHADALQNYQQ